MSDIPDGVDFNVAEIAVAWAIAKIATEKQITSATTTPQENLKQLTNTYIKAHKALSLNEPIKD